MSLEIPDFFEIRNKIAANFIAVFGEDLNTDPNSPTGQLIDLTSNSYLQLYQLLQAVDLSAYAQQSQGQSLDNLLALINVFRPEGTRTFIPNVTLTGTPGITIPSGSLAKTSSGNVFYSAANVTLSASGSALVDFFSQTIGNVVVDQNALNEIVTPVAGWSAVTNGSAGITGLNVVPDATLRANLPKLVNQYSLGYIGNIRAKIFSNEPVIDVFIYENDKSTVAPPPFSSPNNSLWIIIYYEDETKEQEIAESIFNAKSAVSTYSSNLYPQVIKQVVDISGTSHDVSWNKAVKVPLYISVKLEETSKLTIDASALIKETLVNYIRDTHKIGNTLWYNRLLCSIASLDPNIEIEDFWVSIVNPPNAADVVDLIPAFYEVYTLSADNITIVLL